MVVINTVMTNQQTELTNGYHEYVRDELTDWTDGWW